MGNEVFQYALFRNASFSNENEAYRVASGLWFVVRFSDNLRFWPVLDNSVYHKSNIELA